MLGELGQDLLHGAVQVDLDAVLVLLATHVGEETSGVLVHLLDEQALFCDLGLDVAVGAAGDAHAHRAGGAMAGQADHADVVGEVLAAELGADTQLLGLDQELLLELDVAEGAAVFVAGGGQVVEVFGRSELHGLENRFGGGAADHEGDVVRGASRRAEGLHLLDEELLEARGIQERLCLLEQVGLVGRAAALGDEQELVGHALDGVDVDLGREVGAGVLLGVHVQGDGLRIAQVVLGVGVVDALGDELLVAHAGPDLLSLLGDHGGGAGILADGELAFGRDLGVAQHRHRDALVVGARLGILQDLGHHLVVLGAQEEADFVHGGVRELLDGLGSHLEDLPSLELRHRNALGGDAAVLRGVFAERERILVDEFGRGHCSAPAEKDDG